MLLAAELGFEPRQTVSETGVLPLHNSAMSVSDQRSIANQNMKINKVNAINYPRICQTEAKGGIAPISVSFSLTLPMSS